MKNSITIEKGIKPPLGYNVRKMNWPFGEMKVGDSFLVPDTQDLSAAKAKGGGYHKVRTAASYYGLRNPPFKFSIRSTLEGLRCWRIA